MSTALLATFTLMPEGEPGGQHLVHALAERGIEGRWVRWDDPAVDWAAADVVAARSTWDYFRRLPDFLDWARRVGQETLLLNGAEVFTWNADKAYLTELGDVPVVPTRLAADGTLVDDLGAAIDEFGTVVVKPRTGAGGLGVVVADHVLDHRLALLSAGPWVVQPLVESVRTEGETSVYVFEGRAVSQFDKHPEGDQILVHEHFGGTTAPGWLTPETSRLAEAAVAMAAERFGAVPAYGRVDMMRVQGTLSVSELELIEPGLYLDVNPGNAAPFAEMVAARLR